MLVAEGGSPTQRSEEVGSSGEDVGSGGGRQKRRTESALVREHGRHVNPP